MPFTEFMLGFSNWQKITLEVPNILVEGQHGFGDVVLGTKVMPLRETADVPGIAVPFEWKLSSASMAKGLGSGSMEFGFLLRS